MFDPASFMGAQGGMLALAFGAGCASGYGFAIRTAYRAVKRRLDKVEDDLRDARQELKDERVDCAMRITGLTVRQRELEDMLLGRRPLGFFTPIEREEGRT